MKKQIFLNVFIIVISLIVFSESTHSASLENLPELVKSIKKSVVSISTFDRDSKPVAIGTGFFVNKKGEIVTNRHVMYGSSIAHVETSGGKVYQIEKVISEDIENDLIKLSVNVPQAMVNPVRISTSLPVVGEKVIVIGSPLGLEQTVSDGIVSAIRELPKFGKIIQLTSPVSSGSSGSPVVDMKGMVVGVATFQSIVGQNLNFAIPSGNIANLKDGLNQTLPEWEDKRSKLQPVKSGDGQEDSAGEKNYSLSEGFRSIKWGTRLTNAKKIYPDLLLMTPKTSKTDMEYYRRKNENKIISGVEWDSIRYLFKKNTGFYSVNAEARFEPEDKDKAIAQYNELYQKIAAKYGKPFHAEKSDREGYPYVYYSSWDIGSESVTVFLRAQQKHFIFRNSGVDSKISMLEFTLDLYSKKGEAKALDF